MKAKIKRLRAIRKALAEGKSFEQILARNPTLNYHDIFRAAAEVPTSYWSREQGTVAQTRGNHTGPTKALIKKVD